MFIEYKDNPLAWDLKFYQNSATPYVSLYFIDAITNKPFTISDCVKTPIRLYLPFNSYQWVDQVNAQLNLFLPGNYYGPDHPIFKSPIFINQTGFVSDDTVEERIARFQRNYNFSCSYFVEKTSVFNTTGLVYSDLSKTNFIKCNTTHTTDFSTFIIPNIVQYNIDGPFFYLKYPQVFTYWPNYTSNFAFFISVGLIGLFLIAVCLTTCWDWKYYRQEVLLEYIKYNIVRVQMPYNQKIEFNPEEIFPVEKYLNGDNDPIDNFDRFGQDEGPGANAFAKIGGEELDNEMKDKRYKKKDKGAFDFEFNADDNDKINLYDDDVFNLNEDGMNEGGVGGRPLTTNNPFINRDDKDFNPKDQRITIGNFKVEHLLDNQKNADDEYEDEEKEQEARLENFASLSMSLCEFFIWNVKARHVLINPIIVHSIFNPRYKKFTCLVTEISIMMILLSVFITADQTVLISFNTNPVIIQNIGKMIFYSLVAALSSNIVMYLLVFFFRMTNDQRKLLFKTVKKGINMRILRVWGEIEKKNTPYTVLGMLINIIIWLGSLYFSFNYVAVWTAWDFTWLIAVCTAVFIDLGLMEFGFEFFIAVVYNFRISSPKANKFAEWMNRVRSYRSLWP